MLQGPYALVVTGGSTPGEPDLSFMQDLDLKGMVTAAERGYVVGQVSGVSVATATVGWANTAAQNWTTPTVSGDATSPTMKPGTYTQTLYQDEPAGATRSVKVAAGGKTTGANLTSTWTTPANPVFTIGGWDGTPTGFKNAANLTSMHPSDARMTSWTSSYTVGTSIAADFPAYQWQDINGSSPSGSPSPQPR